MRLADNGSLTLDNNLQEAFIEDIDSFTYICHGRVLEVDHHELFYSKYHKIANSILRGEPYQYAHQSIEYRVRLGNLSYGRSTDYRDYNLFGNYLGMIKPGDEVKFRVRKGPREKVVAIYNCTTGRQLRPSIQLSAGVVRLFAVLVTALLAGGVYGVYYLITSGVLWHILMKILYGLIGMGLVLWIYDLLFFRFFRKRK